MQLSSRYTDNIFSLRVSAPVSGSHSVTFNASWDFKTITDGNDYDTSNIYTLCVDNDLNTYSNVLNYSADINRYVVNTEIHTAVKNAMPLAIKAASKTNLTQTDVYTMTGRNAFLPDKTFISNGYNNINNGSVDHVYIVPYIYAITKENFEKDYFVARTLGIADSDISRITLQELYENPDKYYVTHYTQNAIYWFSPSNNNQMGIAFPFRYLYQTDENFSMANYCDLGSNNIISTSVPTKTGIGSYYAQSSTGSGGSPFYFSNLQRDIKSNANNIIPCEITNLDYSPTFDNETKIIKGKNDIWKCTSFMGDGYKRSAVVHAFTAEYILKLIASQGLYVSWNNSYVNTTGTLKGHSNIAIGEMNEKGYTTGVIIPPSEKASSNSPNLNYGLFTDSIADPEKYRPAPSGGDDIDNIQLNALSGYGSAFTRYYIMTRDQLFELRDWINSDDRAPGYDALDNIISMYEFPYDVVQICTTVGTSTIKIGSETYGTAFSDPVAQLILAREKIIDAGSITVPARYGNYLDYEPYTTASVYIPYCGVVDISLNYCAGKEIKVQIIADVLTGSCRGVITCGSVILASKAGQIGNEVVLTSDGVGRRHAALLSGLLATAGGIVGTAAAATSGNVTGAAAGGLAVLSGITKLEQAKNASYSTHIGNTSADVDYNLPASCYLFMTQPVSEIPDSYAHSEGYPCLRSEVFSDCKGYTVVSNADLSGIAATAEELSEIKRYLDAGVIVQYE